MGIGKFKSTLALVLLVGCGSSQSEAPSLLGILASKSLAMMGIEESKTQKSYDPRVIQAAIDKSGLAAIVANYDGAPPSVLYAVAQNGPYVTYSNEQLEAITFLGGAITGTRNLAYDLFSISFQNSPIASSSTQFGGKSRREMEHLGEGPAGEVTSFECSYRVVGTEQARVLNNVHSTTHVEEFCSNAERQFKNDYWVATNGFVWKSRQYLGHDYERPVYLNIGIVEPLT